MAKLGIARERSGDGKSGATVFVVDDDPDVRQSISILVRSVDLNVEVFGNAQDFLDGYTSDRSGCLILDVRMPGMTGLQLQQQMRERVWEIPTIILTAYAEVAMATQAMRAGAVDFIQKPFSPQALLERIHEAIQLDATTREEKAKQAEVAQLIATLSPREREVMMFLGRGQSTKEIAIELGISIKTVDNHRASVLEKMMVDNATQLALLLARIDPTN